MEIDLAQVAQRLALLGLLSGIGGAITWQLIWGALGVLAQRLQDRAARLRRVAQAKARANDKRTEGDLQPSQGA